MIKTLPKLDKYAVAQVPLLTFALLLFYCRGYLAWLISLTYSQDRSYLLTLFYPHHQDWQASLLVGLPAMLFGLAWMRRLPQSGRILRWLWHRGKVWLWLAWCIDVAVLMSAFLSIRLDFSWGAAMGCVGNLWIGLYLYKSKQFSLAVSEYPQNEQKP